uniref:Uncharacterized protein n=1 Tax=Aegilops tauschii subsp. strangulata TaxID=200361 RepID=A0A453GYB2_AEGTS
MALQAIEENRKGAEVYHGAALCAEKATELLAETNMPLADIEEVGYNRSTGFVWLARRRRSRTTSSRSGGWSRTPPR